MILVKVTHESTDQVPILLKQLPGIDMINHPLYAEVIPPFDFWLAISQLTFCLPGSHS